MKFQMPEAADLEKLTRDELEKLSREAWEEYTSIAAKDDADVTDEDLADLDRLNEAVEALDGRIDAIDGAAQERADKLAAARSKVAEAEAEVADPEADPEDPEEGDPAPEGGEGDPDPEAEVEAEQEQELVTASATPRRRTVRAAASRTPAPAEVIPDAPRASLIAAANLPTIAADTEFTDLSHAARVWEQRISKGPAAGSMAFAEDLSDLKPVELKDTHVQQGFLKIKRAPAEFSTGLDMSATEQLRVIDEAADERKRFGSDGLAKKSLTAAGTAWCAPSENLYDFCSYETVSGILDIPTIQIRHGGINFTKGPDYATLAASWGFLQTEAQAIANTAKTCYPVACPPFAETRMDAVGFCVTAGVLTASPGGYPELIRRVLEIGTVAHAHKVNAQVISRIQTIIGAATDYVELGAATSDLLQAIEIAALRMRYSLAMAENATLEVVLPVWAKSIIRADMSRRPGQAGEMMAVTDAMINAWFAVRGVRVQWIFDYQPLGTGALTTDGGTLNWTGLPTQVEFMMWPAGAFIKGTSQVIDMDTIYDSVGLSTNTYTAAFFEEGLLVANRCGFGVRYKVTFTGSSAILGHTGAQRLGQIFA